MGCGKSSVGKELSALLGCTFIDLDRYIETKSGCTIAELFTRGENFFRSIELECLSEILSSRPDEDGQERLVLALGGGTILDAAAQSLLERTCRIYLRASRETIEERLSNGPGISCRPLLGTRDIPSLLAERVPVYERTASITIDTDGLSPSAVADRILEIL